MNILFTNIGFLPAVGWGGPVKIIYQNALELCRRGHQVTVCSSNLMNKRERIQGGSFERLIDNRVRAVFLNTYTIPNWSGTVGPTMLSPKAAWYLWCEVKAADVVHVNGFRNVVALASMIFAQVQGKRLIFQPHGSLPHIVNTIRLKRVFDWLFAKRLFNIVDLFIASQKAEVLQIIEAGGEPHKIRIVPNGIVAVEAGGKGEGQERFYVRFQIPLTKKIILFLARINRKKGTDLLVEAYAQLPEAVREETVLVIAGPDDGQLAEVQRLIEQHKLEKVVLLTGLLEGGMANAALLAADIFVLPCRVDTFPMAIVEACRAGLPMVITETCEIADILKDKVATIVPVDTMAIRDAILQLLETPSLQQRYKQGAKELMQTAFSIEAVGEMLERIYAGSE